MHNNPYFLLILAPLIWGGNAVASKLAVNEIAPMTLVLLRWTMASVVLLPFVLPAVKRDWVLIRQHWLLLSAYGCFGFAAFNLLFYTAIYTTTAINLALLQASIPILILGINGVFFRHGFNVMQIVGLCLALIGVALIVTAGHLLALLDLSLNKGDGIMLIACVIYALYSIGLRYKPNISWSSFIFVLAISAWLTSLPFALYEIWVLESEVQWSLNSILLIIYIGVFASIVAQLAYAKGIGLIGASRGGFALNLVPIFGVILSVFILDEMLKIYHIIALILVLGGIALSEKSSKSK